MKKLMASSAQWNKLKMVFLGHGEVGKTTLLHTIMQLLHERRMIKVEKFRSAIETLSEVYYGGNDSDEDPDSPFHEFLETEREKAPKV